MDNAIKVGIVLPSGTRHELDLDPQMCAFEVIDGLFKYKLLTAGAAQDYHLSFKEGGTALVMDDTLEQNNVHDGDTLLVTFGGQA